MDEIILLVIAAVALYVIYWILKGSREPSGSGTSVTNSARPGGAKGGPSPSRSQMVQDIKATKTSRVLDQVDILNELGKTTQGFRQYCELVGTSEASSGVIAPYSKREVAYYHIRCYRIDHRDGRDVETIVAEEHSIDPFYFTDPSCDTRVYVDLESFGDNVILVNSTNHIEGPNSDFAKAVGNHSTTSKSGSGATYAIMGRLRTRLGGLAREAHDAVDRALLPGGVPAVGIPMLVGTAATDGTVGSNILFAGPGGHGPGGPGGPGRMGGFGGMGGPGGPGGFGGRGGMGMPPGMGDFLGGARGGWVAGGGMGMPRGGYGRGVGDQMLDIGLGMLLGSLAASGNTTTNTTSGSNDEFRGYRLVEDVVPLNSPTYCIGEIYYHGTDVYMGHSLAEDYPTSYFATKPEADVVSSLGA